MSTTRTALESSPSSSKRTRWTKLLNMPLNMLSMHHRSVQPLPPPPAPISAPRQEVLLINFLEPELEIIWNRSRSARIRESKLTTRSCRSSSVRNSIHPVKGRSFSMTHIPVPHPLPPVPRSALTVPQSVIMINFSDLKRDNKPIRRDAGGTVYKAVHRLSGRLYSLKVIDGYIEDSVWRQIFDEVQILSQVANPNVVQCHDMFDHNGEICVLLEYMNAGSLKGKYINNEKVLSNLARQILSGLTYLHRRRIAHRDIKPANLLFNNRNEVKIADFVGRVLAKTMDPYNSCVGNIAYMCPERINTDLSQGQFNAYAGDIWSFGISILEVYLGRYPFPLDRYQKRSWSQLVVAICMSEPPEAPPTASTELRDFIACCLKREPQKRMTAAQLLQHPYISGNGVG